jgi:hypothetical protein
VAEDALLSLEDAFALDDEDLLEEVGEWLLGSGPGFGPSDIDRKVRFARSWLDDKRNELRRELCGPVRDRLETGGFDAMTEAATVADAVAAAVGKPPANIVAVILLRRGIRRFCD